MKVYAEVVDGYITSMSLAYVKDWVETEIKDISEMNYTPGCKKVLKDGGVSDIVTEQYTNMIIKDTKIKKVARIKVTTDTGKVFDGDEKSQERILRAINIATITGDTTQWKMADNTVVDVTLEELKEALALAGKEMSRIWLE